MMVSKIPGRIAMIFFFAPQVRTFIQPIERMLCKYGNAQRPCGSHEVAKDLTDLERMYTYEITIPAITIFRIFLSISGTWKAQAKI